MSKKVVPEAPQELCVFKATHRKTGMAYVGVSPVECSHCDTDSCEHGPSAMLRLHAEHGFDSHRPFHVFLNADGVDSFDIDIIQRGMFDEREAFKLKKREVYRVPLGRSLQYVHFMMSDPKVRNQVQRA